MTTDEAVEFVARAMNHYNPSGYPLNRAREIVELARRYIAADPTQFVDTFLAGIHDLTHDGIIGNGKP